MKGDRIESLDELIEAAHAKKSVIIPNITLGADNIFRRNPAGIPLPAAFVQNFQGRVLWRMLAQGIYLYEKEPKSDS